MAKASQFEVKDGFSEYLVTKRSNSKIGNMVEISSIGKVEERNCTGESAMNFDIISYVFP